LEEGIPLDVADEVDDPEDDLEPGDALPGGIASGLFLHEVLQRVDFAAVRAASDLASWRQDATAGELVARLARRHGLERRHLPRALELVWRALRTPLSCGSLRLEEGLCAARRRVAEMEFLFPIPEAEHPLLGRPPVGDDPLPFRVRRGYFQGVIDLFFEHDERVYFLDWKSDQRGEWTPEALRGHVERHYALQRQLYTLAVIRAAGLEGRDSYEHRFGGLLYCFLRGMERVGDQIRGVHFERPARDEVATWERELLARRYPGAAAGGP
jgi:exodeoxyribonuclease V beta subunit